MKILYITAILFFGCISIDLTGQSAYWQWAKSAGGSGYDQGNGISTDGKGNSYVTGDFTSPTITFGSYTLTNNAGENVFVVKYDSTGNVIWAKCAQGNYDDGSGSSIAADGNGNVYITGAFQSSTITFGNYTLSNLSNPGTWNVFVVEYDSAGKVIWAKCGQGTGFAQGSGISTDGKGNVYVIGNYTIANIIFGSYTLSISNNNIFIVKYDSTGNVIWAESTGGIGSNSGTGISTDGKGNSYVTGYFQSYIGDNVFIAKYDLSGNLIWTEQAGGSTNNSFGQSISTDGKGNAYITGYFTSNTITFGSFILTNSGSWNVFVVKYDSTGSVIWAKNALGSGKGSGGGISADSKGNAYVTGKFTGSTITFGSYTLINSDYENVFVVKYDLSGNVIWAESAGTGGTNDAWGESVRTDGHGNAYTVGTFTSSTLTLGNSTLINNGYYNIFVGKIANCVLPGVRQISVSTGKCRDWGF